MIKIICDSCCDVLPIHEKELNIAVVPLTVEIDGTVYRDRIDITNEEFFAKLLTAKEFPKTALAGPELFLEQYRKAWEEGYDSAIVLTLPAAASGTCQAAKIAAEMMREEQEMDITVVDSQMFSYPAGLMVTEAAKMARDGAAKEEILARIRFLLEHTEVYFTVPSLNHLRKGGRISVIKAAIGTVLDLKPILTIRDGLITHLESVRGEKKAIGRMMELVASHRGETPIEFVAIGHGSVPDRIDFLRKKAESTLGLREDRVFELGIVIGAHAGPGLSAVFVINPEFENKWIKDEKKA